MGFRGLGFGVWEVEFWGLGLGFCFFSFLVSLAVPLARFKAPYYIFRETRKGILIKQGDIMHQLCVKT